MKKKALFRETLREIWRSRNRFLSIFAIVAIGSGFFAGVKSSCPDMRLTAEHYFADQQLADLHLLSTYGFNDEDLAAVEAVGGIRGLMPSYSADLFLKTGTSDNEMVVKALSYELESSEEDPNYLNRPVVVDGRLPERADECVVEQNLTAPIPLAVGDEIILSAGGDSELSDMISRDTFTIVGIVESPSYVNFERGSSTIGDGVVDSFILLPKEVFSYEVYTDLYLTLEATEQVAPESEQYQTTVAEYIEQLKLTADHRQTLRYQEIYQDAAEQLAEAKQELADGEEKQQTELADARQQISDAQQELTDGWAEYEKQRDSFDRQISEAEQALTAAADQLEENRQTLAKQESQYQESYAAFLEQKAAAQPEIDANQAQLNEQLSKWQSGNDTLLQSEMLLSGLQEMLTQFSNTSLSSIDQLPENTAEMIAASSAFHENLPGLMTQYICAPTAQKSTYASRINAILNPAQRQIAQQRIQLDETKAQLDAAQAQLDEASRPLREAEAALMDARAQLDDAANQLSEGESELNSQRSTLKSEQERGEQELSEAKKKLLDGEQELADAKAEYEQAKIDSDQELADGRQEIADAEAKLADLAKPKWYLWDREQNPGYADYYDDTEKVDAIAKVFPVFFVLVALLVCLTTMTRMVEEQRTQIGTLKALGYGKGAIMSKYLVYATAASILGCGFGLAIGFPLLPTVIFNAYKIMYRFPAPVTPFRLDYAIACTVVAVLCTGTAALIACYKELATAPAQLMRPKAPKSGKRVLLERIPWLWNRFSFTYKVTLRNLFRYKQRLLMTIIGIAGCTALILTGFGLRYSINAIAEKQFNNVFLYDGIVALEENLLPDEVHALQEKARAIQGITNVTPFYHQSVDVASGSQKRNVNLMVPIDSSEMEHYISLQERVSGDPLTLTDDGVIINEKLAKMFELKSGDSIEIQLSDTKSVEVTITGINENYTMHYIYMTANLYEQLSDEPPIYNTLFIKTEEGIDESTLSEQLLDDDQILGISYSSNGGSSFRDLVKSLDSIVWVLIVAAGALAFVVMYNLVNINVNERIRELATIKVLGFYDGEVTAYIYRENTFSAILGILAGLLGGVFLERFVVQTAEVDVVMFAPDIPFSCFLLAFLITLLFIVIVNLVVHFRLKKINMVESLKSVE